MHLTKEVEKLDKAVREWYEQLQSLEYGTPFFYDVSNCISYTNGGARDVKGHNRYVRSYKKAIRTRLFGKNTQNIQKEGKEYVRLFVQEVRTGKRPFDLGAWAYFYQVLDAWWDDNTKGGIKKSFLVSKPNAPAQHYHVDHKSDLATYNNSEYLLTKTKTKINHRNFVSHNVKPTYETWIKSIHFSVILAMEGHTFYRYCTGFDELNLKLIGEKEKELPLHSIVLFPGNTIHSGKRHIKFEHFF